MSLFDTHCHLNFKEFDQDRQQVLDNAQQLGISRMLIPAARSEDFESIHHLCNIHSGQLYAAYGLHPVFIDSHTEADIEILRMALNNYPAHAIGETGLDYYRKDLDRERQKKYLSAQLELACECNLPVILHIRKAHDDVLQLLKRYPVKGGIAHAYNGSLQQAEKFMQHGFMFGFGGTLTYPNARHIHSLASTLPLENLVLETDAPDMTVDSHKGQRNSPEYLPECLQALAKLRNLPVEDVARITTHNACKILSIQNHAG